MSLLFDEENTQREQRKIEQLVKQVKFWLQCNPGQIDYRAGRGIEKTKIRHLLEDHRLSDSQNIIFTGVTGCGKTFMGCALGQHFCQQRKSVRYFRLKGLQELLQRIHEDGSYPRFLAQINKCQILLIDDWGMEKLSPDHAGHLLELLEDRYQISSTIMISQLPVKEWYAMIGNATVADALLDRLIHNSHRIELGGESMRKLAQSGQIE